MLDPPQPRLPEDRVTDEMTVAEDSSSAMAVKSDTVLSRNELRIWNRFLSGYGATRVFLMGIILPWLRAV